MLSAKVIRQLLFVARKEIAKKPCKSAPFIFTGRDLVNYIHEHFNEKKRDKDEITEFVRSTWASEELTQRFIWPYKGNHELRNNGKKHVFFTDHLVIQGMDCLVLNVDPQMVQIKNAEVQKAMKKDFESSGIRFPGMKKRDLTAINEKASREINQMKEIQAKDEIAQGSLGESVDKENISPDMEGQDPEIVQNKEPIVTIPAEVEDQEPSKTTYFFENNYKDISILNNIEELVEEIQWTMLRIKGKSIDDVTYTVDYGKIETLEDFKVDFKALVAALPFADIKTLCSDKKVNMSFFINLYNILTIHSLVSWKKLKGRLYMSSSERVNYFNMFKYSVGGYALSLNDIEHGILRGNDNFGRSKWRVYWAGIFTKSFTDRHTPRFKSTEGVRKMALSIELIGKSPFIF